MSRKLEIRTRMAEVQKEFSALDAELKEIARAEKREVNKEKFKEYLYKVGTYGYTLETEDKIAEINDDDRETAHVGPSGLAYTDFEGRSQTFRFVMLKSKEEYSRVGRILTLLEAASALANENTKDKEKHLKVLLGETSEQDPVV